MGKPPILPAGSQDQIVRYQGFVTAPQVPYRP